MYIHRLSFGQLKHDLKGNESRQELLQQLGPPIHLALKRENVQSCQGALSVYHIKIVHYRCSSRYWLCVSLTFLIIFVIHAILVLIFT